MTEPLILVFVGTYTAQMPHVDGKGEGIYVCQLNTTTGELVLLSQLVGVDNPTYLALSPQGNRLYAVNEVEDGKVTACAVDLQTGTLTVLNQQSSHGAFPCHITVNGSSRYTLVANYGGGSLVVLPVEADGRLGKASVVIEHHGSSVNPARQEAAHVHCVALDTTTHHAFVADLGMDKVLRYQLDPDTGILSAANPPHIAMSPGAGPRHLALHSSGRWLFVINELDSTLALVDTETLQVKPTLSTLPDDFAGENSCAAVRVHPSGKFVYGSNRGHDSIAIFTFDENTGELAPAGYAPTQGQSPRDFNIDPTATFLLAANQNSDTVVTFRIDPQTGALEDTGQRAAIPTPVCIEMMLVPAASS